MSIEKKNVSSSMAGTSLWMNMVLRGRIDPRGQIIGGDLHHALADFRRACRRGW